MLKLRLAAASLNQTPMDWAGNRDRILAAIAEAKADPLVKKGGKLVDKPVDLGSVDVVFTMVSTGKDVDQVLFGANGVCSGAKAPKIVVDWSRTETSTR